MDTWQKAAVFLTKRPGLVICDACLRKALRARGELTRMLDVLNPALYRREHATCDICGDLTRTIASTPSPS